MENVLTNCKTRYKSFYLIDYDNYEFANNWYKTCNNGPDILCNGRSEFDLLYGVYLSMKIKN
jgi:hypothetical protein